ncbi:hypothetical protein [Kribbella albertanoniae]|uniref:hypothetical protein n=1 Tax=Kribbella albertanoniae TaxID=1266829 RepID=UPI00192D5D3F|nr:hypothetical protein [Kribbella albertanoniae]
MAWTFETISAAFCRLSFPSSANAIARALEVRFSIREEDADSDRSRMAAKGATSVPSSASNLTISVEASSASASVRLGSSISMWAIAGVTADR